MTVSSQRPHHFDFAFDFFGLSGGPRPFPDIYDVSSVYGRPNTARPLAADIQHLRYWATAARDAHERNAWHIFRDGVFVGRVRTLKEATAKYKVFDLRQPYALPTYSAQPAAWGFTLRNS